MNEDARIGNYLGSLLIKYDKRAAAVSKDAGLAFAYVGNIINGKRNNPSRNVLISISFAMGTTFEEAQYLLKYAGHAPLYVRRKRDVIIYRFFQRCGEGIESREIQGCEDYSYGHRWYRKEKSCDHKNKMKKRDETAAKIVKALPVFRFPEINSELNFFCLSILPA